MTSTSLPGSSDREILTGTVRKMRRALPSVVLYELYYRLVTFAILTPLLAWGAATLVRLSGAPALSNEGVATFLLSPTGLGVLLMVSTCLVAITFIEWAGLFDLLDSDLATRRHPATTALYHSLTMLPRFAILGMVQLAVVGVVIVPFVLVLLLINNLFLGTYDINYYISVWPREFILAIALAVPVVLAFAVVAILLFVQWSFALPLVILEGFTPGRALRESRQLTRGRRWRLALILAAWWIGCLLIGVGISALLRWGGGLLLHVLPFRVGMQLLAVGLLLTAHLSLGFVGAAVLIGGQTAIVWRFFRWAKPRSTPTPHTQPAVPARARFRKTLWLSMVALVLIGAVAAVLVINATKFDQRIVIYAHRGASAFAPENTLASIRLAGEQGADGAEIDVQLTADGVVVLFHDSDLKRVADQPGVVREMTYDELSAVDVGSHSDFAEQFAGEPIPTLAQAIGEARRHNLRLNIELKYYGPCPDLAPRVAAIIAEEAFSDQCVVSSLKAEAITQFRQANPHIPSGPIVAVSVGNLTKLDADFISAQREVVTRSLLRRLRRRGKQLYVWTVNDPEEMILYLSMGIDAILTDDPARLHDLRDQYEDLSRAERILLTCRQWLAD